MNKVTAMLLALVGVPAVALGLPDTRFAVIGDYGIDNANQAAVAKRVTEEKPEFIVSTGDNTYFVGKSPEEDFRNWDRTQGKYYARFLKLPAGSAYKAEGGLFSNFYPVLGNHDWDEGLDSYLAYFDLPESSSGNKRYYSFRRGPVEFFMLSSDRREPDGVDAGSTQAVWARRAISNSTASWQVVVFHHPGWTHHPTGHRPAENMRWDFKLWGADVIFSGHNHNMQHLVPSAGANEGMPVFVQGASGNKLYKLDPTVPPKEAQSKFADWTSFGYCVVTASEESLNVEFKDAEGKVLHTASVTKNAPTSRPTGE